MAVPLWQIVIGIGVVLYAVVIPAGLHKVDEGHLGIYFRGGALLTSTTGPGYHIQVPFVTQFSQVQVTVQTDSVSNIPCGTSGGVLIYFEKVEVVNRLKADSVYYTIKEYGIHYDKMWIYDRLHHEINQFCSSHGLHEVYITLFDTLDEHLQHALQRECDKWAPGIEIVSVRVTKPSIPESIRRNFESMEAEKARYMVTAETQRVVEKEAETEKKRQIIEAQKVAEVASIHSSKEIMEWEGKKKMAAIEDQMHLDREKAQADAAAYHTISRARANEQLLTDNFIAYTALHVWANNTKVYFGEKIPSVYLGEEIGRQFLKT